VVGTKLYKQGRDWSKRKGQQQLVADIFFCPVHVQVQRDFLFYSSSVLIVYEGDAEAPEEANVSIRLVDFAHTFPSGGRRDHNFLAGLSALTTRLSHVLRLDHHDCIF
jgi:1D-myo-inositol-tetrakisphosphate 5-kinase/inositol-polyphosphate multikinase